MEHKKFFYGWYILIVGFCIMFINYGLANGPLGLYLISTTESLGISRMEFSLLYTFRSITMMTCNMFFGVLSQKLGLRRIIFMGCGCICAAMLIFSAATGGWSFYLGGLFLGLGFAMSSTGALSTLIKNWFLSHRGLFTGIILSASGIGSSLGSLLVESWITNLGWRRSFFISAVIVIIIACLGGLVIRSRPEEKGQKPFGTLSDVKIKERDETGVTLKQAIRYPRFYIVMACTFCIGFLTNPVYTNVSPQIVDAGYTSELASSVISLLFIILAISKIVLGQIYDSVGFRRTLCICFSANIIGIILLLGANGPGWYWAFAVIFAISLPLETLIMPFFVSEFFGEKEFPTFLGIALALNSLGLGIGNPVMSGFFDHYGSYREGLMLFLVVSIAVFCLLLFFTGKKHTLKYILGENQKADCSN